MEKFPSEIALESSQDENSVSNELSPPTRPPQPVEASKDQENTWLAWTQVLVGFLLMFSSWGLVNTFGVFQGYYSSVPSFGSSSAISWIGSVQSFLLLLLGAFSGRVVDAGYARPMTMVGSFLIVLGLMAMSLSGINKPSTFGHSSLAYYQIMLSQGVCCGIGMGLVFVPSVSITATYFQKRRAVAVGIVTTGAAFGGIVYPIIFQALLSRFGFPWAVRIVGFVVLVTLGIACVFIRPRSDLPAKKKMPLLELHAFKELAYSSLVLGLALSFMGVYIVYYYVESRVAAAGVDLKGLNPHYLVSFLNVGGIFGRVVPNYLADKTHPVLIQSIFVFVGGMLIFAWSFVLNLPGLIAFCLIYGFFSGAFVSLPPASVASVTPDMSRFGARFGMSATCNALGLLAGPPIAGAIIGKGDGYLRASIFAGLVVVAASISMGISKFLISRGVKRSKELR
ncbi:MFS monocarboxylate transporter [Halenospora varia]|nr:MFS monocarboxylate transporter [Halenospora varia]